MQKTEKMMAKFFGVSALVLIAAAGCTGGDQDGNGATADSPAADKMQKGVDTAQEGAKDVAADAGNAVANGATKVGDATTNAANKMASGMKGADDAMVMTPKIKTALGANAMLAGSNINVNTTDKDVTLNGTVKSMAQKNMAGNIAKNAAPGYVIKNNLTMAGGAMKKGM